MNVTNNTSFSIIACCLDTNLGYGEDVLIKPGETAEAYGPYLGEMGLGSCFVHVEGSIACQQTPDDNHGFQVTRGYPICLLAGNKGVTVRHHEDELNLRVAQWRAAYPFRKVPGGCQQPAVDEPHDETYCIDIRVGYNGNDRESLIELLRRRGAIFPGMTAERGMWQGTKILRVYTTNGENLRHHIIAEHRLGNDFDFEIHFSRTDAERSLHYLPDYDTTCGFDKFSL